MVDKIRRTSATRLRSMNANIEAICGPSRHRHNRYAQSSNSVRPGRESINYFMWKTISRERDNGIDIESHGSRDLFGVKSMGRDLRRRKI